MPILGNYYCYEARMCKSGPQRALLFKVQQPLDDVRGAGEENNGLAYSRAITLGLAAKDTAPVMEPDAEVLKSI